MIKWIGRVFSAAGREIARIAEAARRVAVHAWHMFVALGHLSVVAWDWMVGAGDTIANLIIRSARVMQRLGAYVITHLLPRLAEWILDRLADLEDLARGLVRKLGEFVKAGLDALTDSLGALARFVKREVLDRLLDLVGAAVRWVRQEVIPFLRGLIDDVLDFARAAIRKVWEILSAAWEWVSKVGRFLEGVIRPVVTWLLFLAKLPFEVARAAFEFFRVLTPAGFLAYVLRAFEREGSMFEDWLARWFGEE